MTDIDRVLDKLDRLEGKIDNLSSEVHEIANKEASLHTKLEEVVMPKLKELATKVEAQQGFTWKLIGGGTALVVLRGGAGQALGKILFGG